MDSNEKRTARNFLYSTRKCRWQIIYEEDIISKKFTCGIYLDYGEISECDFKGSEYLCRKVGRGELI